MKRLFVLLSLLAAVMLQLAILGRIQLQYGNLDVLLLVVIAWALQKNIGLQDVIWIALFSGGLIGFISAESFWLVLIVYLLSSLAAFWINNHVWQFSILTMSVCAVLFSLLHLLAFAIWLQFSGANITLAQSMETVILPSVLLAFFASIPVYLIVRELYVWIFPSEEEV